MKNLLGDDKKKFFESKKTLVEEIILFALERLKTYLRDQENIRTDILNLVIGNYQKNIENEKAFDVLFIIKMAKFFNDFVVGEKNKNVCPLGWHVPSDKEWSRLIDSQGDFAFAASKLKSIEKNMWISPEYLTVENVDSKGGKSEDTTKFISQNIENTNSSLFSEMNSDVS